MRGNDPTGATAHAADADPDSSRDTPGLPEAIERKRQSDRVQPRRTVNELFRTFANGTARVMGSPWTFFSAVLLIVVWASSYRLFVPPNASDDAWKKGFDTWQLIINTATTIITFLMVFLIQNTQNRDAKAIHLKLDELIRGGFGGPDAPGGPGEPDGRGTGPPRAGIPSDSRAGEAQGGDAAGGVGQREALS